MEFPINEGKNRFEMSNRTIRPSSTLNIIPEEDFLGVFGTGCVETFILKLDDYDVEEISRKLVTNIKEGEEIFRLYSDYHGYVGFGLFNIEKGKIRYFENDHYMDTDEYKFEKYWNKPQWLRIKDAR